MGVAGEACHFLGQGGADLQLGGASWDAHFKVLLLYGICAMHSWLLVETGIITEIITNIL